MDKQSMTDREVADQARAAIVEEARTAIATRRESIQACSSELEQCDNQRRSLKEKLSQVKCRRSEVGRERKKLLAEIKGFMRVVDSKGKKRYQPKVPRLAQQGGGCIV